MSIHYIPHKPKVGYKEIELLEAINIGDYLYGIATSARSSKLFYQNMKAHATKRLEAEERRRIKKRLEKLAEKNLVLFKQEGGIKRAYLSKHGEAYLSKPEIIRDTKEASQKKWDGRWRMVCFDIPHEHHLYRKGLRELLLLCGFRQVQQSVYISPCMGEKLYEYLRTHDLIGSFVHCFIGEYEGDDSRLRDTFTMTKQIK
jgi:hypothetical protein